VERPDPNIRAASTPRGSLYGDPLVYARACDRVLARTWHLVGSVADLPEPPGAVPVTLLPGCLDEPLMITRDGAGALTCLSNACTHRGALVLDAPCAGTSMRCPYHGRRFALDGKLTAAPGFDDAEGFPTARDDLPRLALGRIGPMLFTSLSPAVSFDDVLAPLRSRIDFFPWDQAHEDPHAARDYGVGASWALWCDNYLEGFHIPYVHRGLARTLALPEYRVELYPHASVQIGVAAEGEPCLELPPSHPDHGERIAGYYVFLFPATALNFYPWGVSVNSVEPMGPTRTRIRYRAWVTRPELRDRGAGAELDRVEREDDAIVERTQRGVRSRLYTRGRYAPKDERAVHHFHGLLAKLLEET
jgi:choline monooxygenase